MDKLTERGKKTAKYFTDERDRVCRAMSDYKHALNNHAFAEAHGGVEDLLKDVLLFTEKWEKSLSVLD